MLASSERSIKGSLAPNLCADATASAAPPTATTSAKFIATCVPMNNGGRVAALAALAARPPWRPGRHIWLARPAGGRAPANRKRTRAARAGAAARPINRLEGRPLRAPNKLRNKLARCKSGPKRSYCFQFASGQSLINSRLFIMTMAALAASAPFTLLHLSPLRSKESAELRRPALTWPPIWAADASNGRRRLPLVQTS